MECAGCLAKISEGSLPCCWQGYSGCSHMWKRLNFWLKGPLPWGQHWVRVVGKGRVFISTSSRVPRLQKQQCVREQAVSFAFFRGTSLIHSVKQVLANHTAFLWLLWCVHGYRSSGLAVLVAAEALTKSQLKLVQQKGLWGTELFIVQKY